MGRIRALCFLIGPVVRTVFRVFKPGSGSRNALDQVLSGRFNQQHQRRGAGLARPITGVRLERPRGAV